MKDVLQFFRDMEEWKGNSEREYTPFLGDGEQWGIGDWRGGLLYEPDMSKAQAEILAFVEETMDPADFEDALRLIESFGIDFWGM